MIERESTTPIPRESDVLADGELGHQEVLKPRPPVEIIGSGVVGLILARELAEQGAPVTVVSKNRAGEPGSTVSSIAVGQFLPFHMAEQTERNSFAKDIDYSREFYNNLALNPEVTGVMRVHNVELFSEDKDWPPGLAEGMRAIKTELPEPVVLHGPNGESIYTHIYSFDTFSINTGKTIGYLSEQAAAAGVQFEVRQITRPELLSAEKTVVDISGTGSKELSGNDELQFFKGHTIIYSPPADLPRLRTAISVDDLIIMPREDGTIVVGALYLERDTPFESPQESDALELFERIGELARVSVDGFAMDPGQLLRPEYITAHAAGNRVVSKGDVQIDTDHQNSNVTHAYGFGGLGWSLGPAIAKDIVKKLDNENR